MGICMVLLAIAMICIAYEIDNNNKDKKKKINKKSTIDFKDIDISNKNISKNLPKTSQAVTTIPSHKFVDINKFKISNEVLKLLWIGDGILKNYDIPIEFSNYKGENVTFINTIEPSCIFTELPIEECEYYDLSKVNNLDYYPNYFSLEPNQKFYYLKWLEDITQPIPIGYVFIFYYGLERHLINGDFEQAFEMILKLKNKFDNSSFQFYSTDALLIAIVLRNKYEYFNKMLNYINNSELLCIVKTFISEPLTPKDIIDIRKSVGFTNNYYIQKDYELFYKTLEKVIINKYGALLIPTSQRIIENATSYLTLAIANFSLEKRTAKIPDIFSNESFKEEIRSLLIETHNIIKANKKTLAEM